MEDDQILNLYFARDEQAIVETDRKYGGYCFTLAKQILNNTQDAEETVSDTYWRAWNAIPPQKPQILRLFLSKITRNLAFSRWRSSTAEKRGGGQMDLVLEELGACTTGNSAVDDGLKARELAQAIRNFLRTLPERDQNIFLRRYFFVEESDAIARRYGMRPGTVLKTLSRSRMKLKKYLEQEGYDL